MVYWKTDHQYAVLATIESTAHKVHNEYKHISVGDLTDLVANIQPMLVQAHGYHSSSYVMKISTHLGWFDRYGS